MNPDIYGYIKEEESRFQTEQVTIGDNWQWSFRDHAQLIFHLKNGVFFTGDNNWLRPFKNIMDPLLNLAYWAEDIEVKDIVLYVEEGSWRVLSFLVKKFHDEVFVKEYNLDTFLDEITESDVDYGGVLTQETEEGAEVLQFNAIAFCDQTDILGAPLGLKFHFSPGTLRKMAERGWGNEKNGATISIEELIVMADEEKTPDGMRATVENKTPGKQIEVYVVKGYMPDHYLEDNNDMEYFCDQVQVCAFYTDPKGNKHGVTLYRKEADASSLKFHTSKKVHGRALGRGFGEALLQPQIWTNFLAIHKTNMLEAGSKTPLWTDDESYTNKNRIQDMENNEITVLAEGRQIGLVPTTDPNKVRLFEGSINEWYEHAQGATSAYDPILGKEPPSGTTFRGQERSVQQGRGLHDRRRGQRAKFVEEHYRDIFIPKMKKEILKGKKFMASLSTEEMQWVREQLAENYANKQQTEDLFNGVVPADKELLKQKFLEDFSKKGNKHILEILKGEFEDAEVKIGINVAGKQKDLFGLTEKIFSIFQFIFANPAGFQQVMKIPGMSRKFNDILEFSGLNEVDFAAFAGMPQLQTPEGQPTPQPSPIPATPLPVA